MTAPAQAPSLLADPANVALLRDLYAHARHVHADHATYPGERVPSGGTVPTGHIWDNRTGRVSTHEDCLVYERNGFVILSAAGVTTVREAAQLLAAIGVLPPRFAVTAEQVAAMAPDGRWGCTR